MWGKGRRCVGEGVGVLVVVLTRSRGFFLEIYSEAIICRGHILLLIPIGRINWTESDEVVGGRGKGRAKGGQVTRVGLSWWSGHRVFRTVSLPKGIVGGISTSRFLIFTLYCISIICSSSCNLLNCKDLTNSVTQI